ncbi:hypothetical protein L0F63_001842 [Massospora cicadina]|nr:hypothetical protein L0F63_001842 [Massospora cicadina]
MSQPLTNGVKLGIKIKVVCRVRPFLAGEEMDNSVTVNHPEKSLVVVNQRNPAEVLKYTFDNCYDSLATQEAIFKENVLPLLQEVFRGLVRVLARRMAAIFKRRDEFLNAAKPGVTNRFEVHVSYMEIYKEAVYDLFKPRDPGMKEGLIVREDAKRNVFVAGLERFEHEFAKACKNRATAATMLNQQSSRSHAILGVDIRIEDGGSKKGFRGKLNLIDLAGSEDNRRTGNDAKRLDESKAINTSLLVLGKVVDAINSRATRIPYRDSKMTRILQPSLGGRSLGMMVVNIAPAKKFFQETYQALNFATKSKEIVNNAVANETKEVHKVRSVSLQSLTSKRPLSRPPSRCGPLQRTKSSTEPPNYRELASRLSDATKKSNAEALIRYAKKRLLDGCHKDALISFKQAQEFSPDDPELVANIRRLQAKLSTSQVIPQPGVKNQDPRLSPCLSTPYRKESSSHPKRGTKRALQGPAESRGLDPPEDDSANSSKTDSLEPFQAPMTTARARRPLFRQAKRVSHTSALKPKSDMASEEAIARVALTDPAHPLLALFRMGKPDMLKGIWPSGVKTRHAIADFVKGHGLNVLGDLIPDAISEKVLLKAIQKFNAQ